MPLSPRCSAVPPALPPRRANSDDGDDGAHTVAHDHAANGEPFENNDATSAAVANKTDNAGQENEDPGSNDEANNEDDDKWGRGT